MTLIVYGSFKSPYSSLASRRVDGLAERGVADVRWRGRRPRS